MFCPGFRIRVGFTRIRIPSQGFGSERVLLGPDPGSVWVLPGSESTPRLSDPAGFIRIRPLIDISGYRSGPDPGKKLNLDSDPTLEKKLDPD